MFVCDWYQCNGWGFWNKREWSVSMMDYQPQHYPAINNSKLACLIIGTSLIAHTLLLIAGDIHPNPGPTWHDISICHANIRSIRCPEKVEHIACSLCKSYDIISLSETWLHSTSSSQHLSLPNFQDPFRRDRDNDSGYGGVLAWVSNNIAAKRRKELEVPNLEVMWLEIRARNNKFLLCIAYRPPNAGQDFWDSFQESLDLAKNTTITNFVIAGDLNADPATPNGRLLIQLAESNNLILHINEPTRITPEKRSTLDQFMTNIPMFVRNTRIEPPVSTNDHCTIGIELHFKIKKCKAYQRLMWDFKNANFDIFRDQLTTIDFNAIIDLGDVNDACDQFSSEVLRVAKQCIPCRTVTMRPNDKAWFTGELRKLLRQKNRAHHLAKASGSPDDWTGFREIRNRYYREIIKSKQKYNQQRYDGLVGMNGINNKKWWHVLKDILGQTSNCQFPPMSVDNKIIVDDKDKANAFNEYFAQASQLDDTNHDLPAVPNPAVPNNEVNQLNQILITETDVMDQLLILDTSKAYGPDGIPPILLKEGSKVICPPLSKLFNKSLSTSTFPSLWKKANVLPIFKKGAKNVLGNFRPISLLSINSKIFEKIVFKYVYNHFKDNFLISLWQSGFQPKMSTVTQLTELYHKFCNAVSEGKEIRVVFLDISKAFDRVWHKGLLHKLYSFGIRGSLLDWFSDYLKDRCQRVVINGQSSEWKDIHAGVPQGSNLGPLLFLVFINDIVYVIRHCQIRLFADDTCLYITVDNREEAATLINEDINNIQTWAEQWLINFSAPKTKTLLISNKGTANDHPNLILQGQVIESVMTHKHLGIVLSHNLRWSAHINDIVAKCTKKINLMKKFKFELDRKSHSKQYTSHLFVQQWNTETHCLLVHTIRIDVNWIDCSWTQ